MDRIDVPVRGGTLATYRMGGDANAEPVLAIHGITASSHEWPAVARALQERATLLAPDLRGRGASHGLPGPYGMTAYVADMLAVLDHCKIERAVLVGHSMGAYAVARFAADHPERVRAAVLVDGGLTLPGIEGVDPQVVLNAVLGPALARLEMTFPSRSAYHDWWRSHPALSGADVADEDLVAYANHDLGGDPPELHSVVSKDAVRTDAGELFEIGKPAHRLAVAVEMLRAPRGMQNQPEPLIPAALAEEWASGDSGRRSVAEVPDVNHYTIVMGAVGAGAVVQSIVRALQRPAG